MAPGGVLAAFRRGNHRDRSNPSSDGRSVRRDSGAAIVEMAILMPLLVLLILGIIEFGGVFKDYLTTSNSVRVGTRLLSAKGNDSTADCNALKAATEAMDAGASVDRIQSIQIYKASPNGDQLGNKTNTYVYTGNSADRCALNNVNPIEEFTGWAPQGAVLYPSGQRVVLIGGPNPLDIVGMRITYRHDWFTGFPPFTGSFTIDETTIVRLEPQGVSP